MEGLTKHERHEVYKMALERLCAREYHYLCDCMRAAHKEFCEDYCWVSSNLLMALYPEFASFKPAGKTTYVGWWDRDDIDSRIACLEYCIEVTSCEHCDNAGCGECNHKSN